MRIRLPIFLTSLCLGCAVYLSSAAALAQNRIVLKSGETTDLQQVYFVRGCESMLIGNPEVEVLEGPPELTLSIKQGMVIPQIQRCGKPVPGGMLVATAMDVKEPKQAQLTYRIKYKTKVGDRQEGGVLNVSLFP
jgi:hypothetical protein